VSSIRRDRWSLLRFKRIGIALSLALAAQLGLALPASAQFLPEGFFAQLPEPGAPAQVEANTLNYDAISDVISATGRVVMNYSGYTLGCDSLRYEQGSGSVICEGNVEIKDAQGTRYQADRIEVTGGMKEAFIKSLTLTTTDGAQITASDAKFSETLETVLTDASYSPCGLCIDEKGHRIGWKVKAAKLVQNNDTKVVYFEQPSLEVLGVPVAWLPWLSLPDPTNKRNTGFQLRSVDYKSELGGRVRIPYFIGIGEDTDILLAPQLMTRQGALMAATWQQRFDYGAFNIEASGLYQLDPSAFSGTNGDRDWRGAVQSYGHFDVTPDWQVGWNYTAFTDAGYLGDYDFDNAGRAVNEVYATHLSDDFFVDVRLQEFKLLGRFADQTAENDAQNQQALTIPNARTSNYFDLGANGQIRLDGTLLGVQRDANSYNTYGTVPYVLGYEGQKFHGTAEASWQNQYILPGGFVATPYLGIRGDLASYEDGTQGDPPVGMSEPSDQLLFNATPVAAMDVRWPMIASSGPDSFLLEPIAQLVWRGSDTTEVGITNDNAHSFVLDDTNLFSYNRFTGTDRQETGLRANIGGRYLANFSDGSWLELMAGQSFHLAGVNAMGVVDETNTGASTGLGDDASYIVLGARGSPVSGLTLGAKAQIDVGGPTIARAGLGADYSLGNGYSVGGDYIYLPADTATGVTDDQHEVTVRAGAPLPFDYWRVEGSTSWDLATSQWLESTGRVYYDDGYFLAGGFVTATGPTHTDPDSIAFGMSLKLKAPGAEFGLDF
jgi:LPS-assembly protein